MNQKYQSKFVRVFRRDFFKNGTLLGLGIGFLSLAIFAPQRATAQAYLNKSFPIMDAISDRASDGSPSNKISGAMSEVVDQGKGTFCQKYLKYGVTWGTTIERGTAEFDDEGSIKVNVVLASSSAKFSGYRKGGIMCSWMGGDGELSLGRFESTFKLYSKDNQGTPGMRIDRITLDKFAIGRVSILLPGGIRATGNAPTWMNEWVEKSLKGTLSFILTSKFKQNLEDYLAKKIGDYIDEPNHLNKPSFVLPTVSFDSKLSLL